MITDKNTDNDYKLRSLICSIYNSYFESPRKTKDKAYYINELMGMYDQIINYSTSFKKQKVFSLFLYNMVDTILFDNQKPLEAKTQEELIVELQKLEESNDEQNIAKAYAIATVNKFYNSFKE